MAHSVIVSNIPVEVSNLTVMKFIQLNELTVEHIQPFPDEYHHINEAAQTKTLQVFTDDAGKHQIGEMFKDDHVTDKLVSLEKLTMQSAGASLQGGARGHGRRISVTIL
ncbi:AGR224Cp [Eremothecium gossypii ATCC 10895]|uniref:AGR224Cp n=1 Tax=Eremothecium gossypii (strain ATCC 10895 / CBS 109.51 / FGSC 9923 / NRRL Y-1056) TaxID=284811 RepID=Q74ZW5_EREGS|nr:AGR224Cp [Eremothecium gossypii ATCC 10895]AAS54714.1 AGR224Cp [Eremothecium gossypii ATCC 10895]AEY99044.1 FAGR224Cp [Eremothecium gossypii FDAG1]